MSFLYFLFCFFFLFSEIFILNLCQDTEVLSLNEKCMQEAQPMLNYNELSSSNVMKLCQMLKEIIHRILKEAFKSQPFLSAFDNNLKSMVYQGTEV